MTKPRVLTLVDWYIPAYKAGGPIRSVAYMAARLSDDFDFHILTGDRDLNDMEAFPDIVRDRWQTVGRAQVMYLSPQEQTLAGWKRRIHETEYDILYLNSLLSTRFTILPMLLRLVGQLPDHPVVLAPRGMFSPGFLALKPLKRCGYIRAARAIGLFSNITWQASSEYEEADIRRWFGPKARVVVAPNVPRPNDPGSGVAGTPKTAGSLRLVFLSRISPKKNLDGALRLLKEVRGAVHLSIYGPREDAAYWALCEELMADLPPNITASYEGEVPNERVGEEMQKSHVFFFPTLGENFGHVILEALLAGCPVVLSDQTPWRALENEKVGYDLPLQNPSGFVAAVQRFVDMDAETFAVWRQAALCYGQKYSNNETVIEKNRHLFYQALSQ